MTEIPSPPVPADADLQDFPFMPLHVARLRDSDLAAEEDPEACWYAVLLWAASWHQIPAGSLPENETVLCKLIGLGRDLKTFRKHRGGAMRGFVKCEDGRLYHPVVAEQALAAWKGKLEQRWRTECARIRKANQRNGTEDPQPTFDDFVARDWPLSVPFVSQGQAASVPSDNGGLSHVTPPEKGCDIASKGKGERKGQGQGQGDSNTKPETSSPSSPTPDAANGGSASGGGGKYAFAGSVIRLTPPDLAKWEEAYHAIPDLRAELETLDPWIKDQDEATRKRWFHVISGTLNKKHQAELRAKRQSQNGSLELPIC